MTVSLNVTPSWPISSWLVTLTSRDRSPLADRLGDGHDVPNRRDDDAVGDDVRDAPRADENDGEHAEHHDDGVAYEGRDSGGGHSDVDRADFPFHDRRADIEDLDTPQFEVPPVGRGLAGSFRGVGDLVRDLLASKVLKRDFPSSFRITT